MNKIQLDLLNDTEPNVVNDLGYVLPAAIERVVSKFVTGKSSDEILAINVFIDPVTKKIIKRTLPENIRDQYDDYSIDI